MADPRDIPNSMDMSFEDYLRDHHWKPDSTDRMLEDPTDPHVQARRLRQTQSEEDKKLTKMFEREEEGALAGSVYEGVRGDPERTAKALPTSRRAGVPIEMAEADANKDLDRDHAYDQWMRRTLDLPVVRQKAASRETGFARTFIDKLDNMEEMERLEKKYGKWKPVEGEKVDWGNLDSVGRFVRSYTLDSFALHTTKGYYGALAVYNDMFGAKKGFDDAMLGVKGANLAEQMASKADNYHVQAVAEGVGSLFASLPAVAATLVNPVLGYSMITATTGLPAYGKYRERGGSKMEAAVGGVAEGAIEAVTEMMPMGWAVKNLGKVGLGTWIAGFLGREALGEQFATHTQDAVDTAIANPNKTWGEYMSDRPDASYKTFVATLVSAGFFTGLHAAARNQQNALSATENHKHLAEMANAVALSKMMDRDVPMTADFLQSLANTHGSIETVYVSAAAIEEAIQKKQVDATRFSQETLTGLREQADLDGDIAIPIGEYMTGIATVSTAKHLVEMTRTNPDGMNLAEADTFLKAQEQQFQQTAAEILAKQAENLPFHQGAEAVRTQVLDQLTAANRFTPDVNTAYASFVRDFYTTLAGRMGVTPDQAFAKYGLQVKAAAPTGQAGDTRMTQVEFLPPEQMNTAVHARAQEISQKYGVHMGAWMDRGAIYLGMITVPPEQRGTGVGSRAMGDIKALADEQQVPIRLIPSQLDAEGTTSVEDLQRFYAKNGFTMEQDAQGRDTGYMRYDPAESLDFTLQQRGKKAGAGQTRAGTKRVGGESAVRHELTIETVNGKERYVGGPDYINLHPRGIQHGLAEIMEQLRALAVEGTRGKLWYERSGKAILAMVNGDKAEARKIAGLIAIYSPNNNVKNNTGMALNAYYQFKAGQPIKAGFGDANEKADILMRTGKVPETTKVFSFFQNLLAEIDAEKVVPNLATMDLWMAIAMGYHADSIDQGTKYGFAEGRIKEIADEFGWHPHQVQAAVWVAIRGRVEAIKPGLYQHEIEIGIRERNDDGTVGAIIRDKKATPTQERNDYTHYKLAREWGMRKPADDQTAAEAAMDFSDELDLLRTQISWEATPGKKSGVLPGIHTATIAEKEEYLIAVRKALTGKGGVDLIAKAVGLPQGETVVGFGAWEGDMGVSAQQTVPVPAAGAGAKRFWKEGANAVLKRYAAARGLLLAQDSVIWSGPVWQAAKARQNGVEIRTNRSLSHDEGKLLYDRLIEVLGNDKIAPAYSAGGARIVNVRDSNFGGDLTNVASGSGKKRRAGFQELMNDLVTYLPADFGGGIKEGVFFHSMFDSVENNWSDNPDGKSYTEILNEGGPDLLREVESLKARVEAVNADFAKRYGWDAKRHESATFRQDAPGVGGGDTRLEEATRAADQAAAGWPALFGLPREALVMPDGTLLVPGPYGQAHEVAEKYMSEAGLPFSPPSKFVPADAERAKRIAAEYEAMKHAPQDPYVLASYNAMISETVAQYEAIVKHTGLKVEFIDFEKQGDPYQGNPRMLVRDVIENNHMWVFSTKDGFGSDDTFDSGDNPLLRSTDIKFGDRPALANDVFRAVHDYFGHLMDGNGFRASGEENAWRAHASMYSEKAIPAMTSETRGQNSWLNFGPHGEKNRSAKVEDTTFADQKTGIMPAWTYTEGLEDERLEMGVNRVGEIVDEVQRTLRQEEQEGVRGEITIPDTFGKGGAATITLLKNADLSTFIHESGHLFLEIMVDASKQTGSPELQQDVQRLMSWFGVADVAAWDAMTLEQKRPSHEKFARGFEAYFFEGKPPTEEHRPLYARFRSWMVNVYKSLTALQVEVTDEVRGVFDRMMASEAQIKDTEAMRGMEPLFRTAQEAGMTPEEWSAYQRTGQAATDEAVRALESAGVRDMAWTRNAKSRALREVHKGVVEKRKAVREEVAAEIEQRQVYRTLKMLKTGVWEGEKLPDHKMSMEALKEMYGDHPAAPWRYLAYGKNGVATSESVERIMAVVADKNAPVSLGVHPDHLAELAGYQSGDAMVRDVLAAEPINEAIEQETDARMLERYGDVTSPGAMARAAEKAVHNQVRARFVATELRALTRAVGDARQIQRAAKVAAETMVGNKKLKDIRPIDFIRLETRAARESRAAQKAGDLQRAAVAKRNQLLGIQGARVAEEANTEVEKKVAYLRKVADSKSIDLEYRDQIELLLGRFNMIDMSQREQRRRASLAEWIKTHEDADIDPMLVHEAGQQHYTTLSLEEFRGLHDAVKQIEHLGRLKHKLLNAAEKRSLKELTEALADSIRENAKTPASERRSGEETKAKLTKEWMKGFIAEHRNFADWLRELDGFKDNGPLYRALVEPANDAANFEVEEKAKATAEAMKIVTPITKASKIRGARSEKIKVDEVGKTFTREEIVGIGLNMGNAVNRERVLTGEGWTPEQLNAVLAKLRKEDVAAIQQMWDFVGSYWTKIEEKQARVTGVRPKRVEALPFNFPGHGMMPGGYWPIAYDPRRNEKTAADEYSEVAKQVISGQYARASTQRGHVKERTESTGMKLRYDFTRVLATHLNKVIHDLAWHEYLIDSTRILRSGPVQSAIRDHYGPEVSKLLKDTLTDVAVGNIASQTHFERAAGYLKAGTSVAMMGWSVTTAAQQPLGVMQSMVKVGPWNFMRAFSKWMASGNVQGMEARAAAIREKSTFMRHRGMTQNREIEEMIGQIEIGTKRQALRDSYFYMIQAMQTFVDIPTWIAAYDNAIVAGHNEKTAVGLADQAVKESQGSGLIVDRPAVMRGSQFKQLWTMFGSYFMRTHALALEQVKTAKLSDPLSVARSAAAIGALTFMPATLTFVLMAVLKGDFDDWDDPEKLARKLAGENVAYLMNMVMFLREGGFAVKAAIAGDKNADYSGPAGARFFASVANLAKQVEQGEIDRAMIKAARDAAGPLFHIPSTQLNRLFDYVWAQVNDKDVAPQSFLGGPPPEKLK